MKKITSPKFLQTLKEALRTGISVDVNALKNEYEEFAMSIFSEGASSLNKVTYHDALIYIRVDLSEVTEASGKNFDKLC